VLRCCLCGALQLFCKRGYLKWSCCADDLRISTSEVETVQCCGVVSLCGSFVNPHQLLFDVSHLIGERWLIGDLHITSSIVVYHYATHTAVLRY
jgi:hypothetical protein